MATTLISRRKKPFTVQNPYRTVRPTTSKIIFLSCEGSATEEEYIVLLSKIYGEVKSKIQLISVVEDEIHTAPKGRTPEQNSTLGKSKIWHLVDRIDKFKEEKSAIYQFDKYPDDEFWVVSDIDDNLQSHPIEFSDAINECDEKGYRYAISNPFFEVWLLMHHDEVKEQDKVFAVTDEHPYEATDHFRVRLADLKVPLKNQKHLSEEQYSDEKVRKAAERAKSLVKSDDEIYPTDLGSHFYKVIDEIIEMIQKEV